MVIAIAFTVFVITYALVGTALYLLVRNNEVPVQLPKEGAEIFEF